MNKNWIAGKVKRGNGRGRQLGFPTANLLLENEQDRPLEGVYACWAKIDATDPVHQAVLHVGPRPTFQDRTKTVEVHILHLTDKDLYNRHISFSIVKRLRSVKKFDKINELVAAMRHDCRQAEMILSSAQLPLS